jgi:hypothetical protein
MGRGYVGKAKLIWRLQQLPCLEFATFQACPNSVFYLSDEFSLPKAEALKSSQGQCKSICPMAKTWLHKDVAAQPPLPLVVY